MGWVADKPQEEWNQVDWFMDYCKHYAYGRRRKKPLRDNTLNRYHRGLMLAEKIVGHSIERISPEDQILFMEKIKGYKQGTRKVTTEIYQRYIAYCIRRGFYDGPNLIYGMEYEIIGDFEPLQVNVKSERQIRRFLSKLETPLYRIVLGLMYYGGLTAEEIGSLKVEAVTDKGVFVHRRVRDELQLLPLPRLLVLEIEEWAQTRTDEKLFDFDDSDRGRSTVVAIFNRAKFEANMYLDMMMKDFRRSGIKHFYERCYDVELTKRYAGVRNMHRGWLHDLQTESEYYMETVAKGRPYYGYGKRAKLQAGEQEDSESNAELRAAESR